MGSASVDVPPVLGWVLLASMVLVACGVIWRSAVQPVTEGIRRLLEILGEDEHGRNLRDRVEVIEKMVADDANDVSHRELLDQMVAQDGRLDNMEETVRDMTTKLLPMVEVITGLVYPKPAAKRPPRGGHNERTD